jgi:hypothetical protein
MTNLFLKPSKHLKTMQKQPHPLSLRFNRLKSTLFSLLLIALLPAAAIAQDEDLTKVKVDFNNKVDFKKYKSFNFRTGSMMTSDGIKPVDPSLPAKKRIEDAITAQLIKKGLQLNTTNPDLSITYLAGVKTKQDAETVSKDASYKNWAPAAWYGSAWDNWWSTEHKEGSLVVDLVDIKSGQMIWRSYTTADVQKGNSGTAINEGMAKAFRTFPPK